MRSVRLVVVGVLAVAILGCTNPLGPTGGVPEGIDQQLQGGDFGAAEGPLTEAAKADPTNVDVAIRLAFVQYMKGDYAAADATLAAVEATAGEQLSEVKLRRALVALKTRNMDDVREHAKASATDEGKLLAAEVHIVDLEAEAARQLLDEIDEKPTVVGKTAKTYLEMLNAGSNEEALAEVTALWSLGDRATACEHASEIIPDLDDGQRKAELQLLWAGRALTSGKVDVARPLVDEILELPSKDQAWRLQATKAQIAIADDEYEQGLKLFEQLESGVESGAVPADGLADARATACALAKDKEVALKIAGDLKSNAIAWCLEKAGAHDEALKAVPENTIVKKFLENR